MDFGALTGCEHENCVAEQRAERNSCRRFGRHNRSDVVLRGCVEAVMLMSADVRRHVLAIVLVLGCK